MNVLLLLGVGLSVAINDCFSQNNTTTNYDSEWTLFKKNYNKSYPNETEKFREGIFMENLKMINKHNDEYKAGKVTFGMGINKFADLNHTEFLNLFSYREKICTNDDSDTMDKGNFVDSHHVRNIIAPKSWIWNEPEEVTRVKEQKEDCNNGWAYSAADAVAGAYFVYNNCNKSAPALHFKVDCLTRYTNSESKCNCKSGDPEYVCEWLKNRSKISNRCLKNEYETVSFDVESCHRFPLNSSVRFAEVRNYTYKYGPVAAYINVEQPTFQFANKGIYYEENCDHVPNHNVLIVGYGTESEHGEYFTVKNSFGTSWGNEGFLNISANATKNGYRIISKYIKPAIKGANCRKYAGKCHPENT